MAWCSIYIICIVLLFRAVSAVQTQWSCNTGNQGSTFSIDAALDRKYAGGWKVQFAHPSLGVDPILAPAVGADGTIYHLLNTAKLVAVSPSGSQKFMVPVPLQPGFQLTEIPFTNILISNSGFLYFAVSSQCNDAFRFDLYCIDGNSGALNWTVPAPELEPGSSIALGPTNTIYAAGNDFGVLQARSGVDGSILWSQKMNGSSVLYSSLKVSNDDGTLYLPDGNGHIWAFDPSGKVKWNKYMNTAAGNILSIHNGNVIGLSGLLSDHIFCANADTGAMKWVVPMPDECNALSDPAVDKKGNIFLNCGNLAFSLDSNGKMRWMSKNFTDLNSNWAIDMGINSITGIIYFLTVNYPIVKNARHELHFLSTSSGEEISGNQTSSLPQTYPPIPVGNALFYLVEMDQSTSQLSISAFQQVQSA